MRIEEIEALAGIGLPSAYLSSASSFSLLTNRPVITHKLVPGLSGLCAHELGPVPVFFVDELPECDQASGILFFTRRTRDDEFVKAANTHWIVQIQQGLSAWQILVEDSLRGDMKPFGRAVFLEWKPGAFPAAIERHHALIGALPDDHFDLGSELEKVAMSSFMLSQGYSNIGNTYLAESWFGQCLSGNAILEIDDLCIKRARGLSVEWSVNVEAADFLV